MRLLGSSVRSKSLPPVRRCFSAPLPPTLPPQSPRPAFPTQQRRRCTIPFKTRRFSCSLASFLGAKERSCTGDDACHVPVLLDEVINLWFPPLRPVGEPIYLVDGTVGGGGHAAAALRSNPFVRLLAMDRDFQALSQARQKLTDEFSEDRVATFHGSFISMGDAIRQASGFPDRVDGILLDLGLNSNQLNNPKRGFTFRRDGPLDMRIDRQGRGGGMTAYEIVNGWSADDLADLFRSNDEPMADAVAGGIVRWRGVGKGRRDIRSTLELRHVIDDAVEACAVDTTRGKKRRQENVDTSMIWHPDNRGRSLSKKKRTRMLRKLEETKPRNSLVLQRCFQALRIEVNDELNHVRKLFFGVHNYLREDGRLVVLAFHPGEDEIVMEGMSWLCREESFEDLTEEPIRPKSGEIKLNQRSRSARLRAIAGVSGVRKEPF